MTLTKWTSKISVSINIVLGIMIILAGCQTNSEYPLKNYYYPVEDLMDGKVYIYRTLSGNTNPEEIWFYKSFKEDDTTWLGAQLYDENFNVSGFQLQLITRDGALLEGYNLYDIDENGISKAMNSEVKEKNLFPFYRPDTSAVFLSSVSFSEPADSSMVHVIRNRRFIKDTLIELWNKEVPAVVFEIKEAIDYDKEGTLTVEGKGIEIYAREIGLVHSAKTIQDMIHIAIELDTIVEMDYFLQNRMPAQ
jgi:hypothetical protein